MSARYQLHPHRPLTSPVLLLATESWVDAGFGARAAVSHVLERIPTEPLATFSADDLIDFRARRPTARISDGVLVGLSWPEVQLRAGQDTAGNDLLALVGPEPDMAWHAFAQAVIDLARDMGVRLVAGMGAFAAPVPHTRPVRLTGIATVAELAERVGRSVGTTEVPAGIQTALQESFAAIGIPAVGIWARVPHYLAAGPYPAAAAALVETLSRLTGLVVDIDELEAAAARMTAEVDEVIGNSEEHRELVRRLEMAFDAPATFEDLPSGDDLAAELERFLRDQQG